MAAASSALNCFNFVERPLHGRTHICVNIIEVSHKSWFIAIAGEQTSQLFGVHTAIYCALADLETIDVDNWKDSSRLLRINVFVGMPCAAVTISKEIGNGYKETNFTSQ